MKILKWIIVLPFIALVLYILARFAFCRENYFTVKTATPMVEKIADYIVVNGVPESLDKIPDLPNELKDCKRKIVYWQGHDIVNTIKQAEWIEIKEKCNFYSMAKIFNVNLRLTKFVNKGFDDGKIDISADKTRVGIVFEIVDEKFVHDNAGSSFDNRFGFCRQFRQ